MTQIHKQTISRLNKRLIKHIDNSQCVYFVEPMNLISFIIGTKQLEFNLLTQNELKSINKFLDSTDYMNNQEFAQYIFDQTKPVVNAPI